MSARQLIELAAELSDWNPDTPVLILDEAGRELTFGVYRCESCVILDVTLNADNSAKEP